MELNENQIRALCLLAAGRKMADVAQETGVSKRAIEVWKTQPEFKKLLREAMARMYDSAVAELVLGAQKAAQTLIKIIDDEETPSKNKISAINILLSNASRAKDAVLEQKLEQLESELDGTDPSED